IMRESGALISGSVALQYFLSEEAWLPGDLDIYVPDRHYRAFIHTLARDPSFALHFHPRQSAPAAILAADIDLDIDDFVLPVVPDDVMRFRTPTGRNVDIVCSPVNNALTALHMFWSTLVTNFLTPDGCGCGFPAGTMNRRGFVK
ncbi:hypothetical protein C8Q76DRAFT_580948, partial [Earliella scabrosa]